MKKISEDNMKKTKILTAALSAFAAAAMLAVQPSAYMAVIDPHESGVSSDRASWKIATKASSDSPFTNMTKYQAVVAVEGDTERYLSELAANQYQETTYDENGDEAMFYDFTGFFALGARVSGDNVTNDWWYELTYNGLADAEGGVKKAEVTKLNNTTFLFSGDLTGVTVDGTTGDPSVSIADWGNKSDYYYLAVKEVYVYGPDGTVTFYSDGAGNVDTSGHAAFDPSAYVSADTGSAETTAETTEEAVTEETAAEETAVEETTDDADAAETTEASTTAAETTTTAAATTTTTADNGGDSAETTAGAAGDSAPQTTAAAASTSSSSSDFASRDSSLMIFGIAAVAVIVVAIVAIIIVMAKKKK